MRRLVHGRVGRSLLGIAVFVAALGLWQAGAVAADDYTVPTMTEVLDRARHVWPTDAFRHAVSESLRRLAVGFALGTAIGLSVGLVMGSWRPARRTLEPLTELLRAVPVIAVVPVVIVLLGFGDAMQVSVIAFGVCFPVLISTLDGVRGVPPEARDTASMLHVRPVERALYVNLPSALPSIVSGLRIALSIGLVLVVISELVGQGGGLGAPSGLGDYIWDMYGQTRAADMYAGILFLGLLGVALNALFVLAERYVLRWHRGATGDQSR